MIKHMIIGFRDGKRYYLANTDNNPVWVEDEKCAYIFCSHTAALEHWFEVDKSQFERVFVAHRQPIK